MQYTVRKIPKNIERALRAKAKAEGKTINAVALELWREALGLNGQKKVHRDLDWFFGTGGLEPEVIKAIEEHDVVHRDDWK